MNALRKPKMTGASDAELIASGLGKTNPRGTGVEVGEVWGWDAAVGHAAIVASARCDVGVFEH